MSPDEPGFFVGIALVALASAALAVAVRNRWGKAGLARLTGLIAAVALVIPTVRWLQHPAGYKGPTVTLNAWQVLLAGLATAAAIVIAPVVLTVLTAEFSARWRWHGALRLGATAFACACGLVLSIFLWLMTMVVIYQDGP